MGVDHTPPLSFSASWVGGGLNPLATTGTVRRHGTEGPVPTHVIPRLSPGPGTVEAALGSNPRGARKCPRGQSRILFFGGLLLWIPLSLSVQSTVYFLVCDCDWWSESFAKGRSIWMIQNNCKNIVFLDRPLQAGWPIWIIRLVCKRVVLTSDPICKWSFILAHLLCKGQSHEEKLLHFWSIKGDYFLQNANNLSFRSNVDVGKRLYKLSKLRGGSVNTK